MPVETIEQQLCQLRQALAQNNFEMKRAQKVGNVSRVIELLLARQQIWMSIAHRQGMLVEFYKNADRFQRSA